MPGREVEARPAIRTMVRAAGIEPARGYPQRIFIPATAFTAATASAPNITDAHPWLNQAPPTPLPYQNP